MNNPEAAGEGANRALTSSAQIVRSFISIAAGKPRDSMSSGPSAKNSRGARRRDQRIWLHPARRRKNFGLSDEDRYKYEIWWTFGWPLNPVSRLARRFPAGRPASRI